jgi:protein-disulfide isomerase
MRRLLLILVGAISLVLSCCRAQAQSAPSTQLPDQAQLIHSAEVYIRNYFTWGPEYKLKLGPLSASPSPDFYQMPIEVTIKDQTEKATFYVSKDGKLFIRGEMLDMSADPFAAIRAKLHITGNPSQGPDSARVTIVEFSDFECPHCREIHRVLQSVQQHYPQIRLVFKDFPLTQLHPWADTAAIGGRCAFQQKPEAFWKVYDQIFDNQDLISAANVFDELVGFAGQAGLDTDAFKACLSSPEAKQAVEANRADGVALGVNSTPTLFINGRLLVGGDLNTIEQFIDFELNPK